jgi:hypothetical protein
MTHTQDYFTEWYLKGSLNGVDFDILHHQTDFEGPAGLYSTNNFPINNTKPYKVLKVVLSKNYGEKVTHFFTRITRNSTKNKDMKKRLWIFSLALPGSTFMDF